MEREVPYETKNTSTPLGIITSTRWQGINLQATKVVDSRGVYIDKSFSRSGTKRNTKVSTAKSLNKIASYRYRWVTTYTGPRLGQKVFLRKKNIWVWKREPVKVLRLLPYYPKQKVARGMDLIPNDLSYSSCSASYKQTTDTVSGRHPTTKEERRFSGDLWTPNQPTWSLFPEDPSIQNYESISQSLKNNESSVDAQALALLYERCKSQSINLAQAMAERRQTYAMIADAFIKLADAYFQFKRGNLKAAVKQLFPTSSKELANDWLIFQYGVKPLLSDIEGAAKYLGESQPTKQFDVVAQRTLRKPFLTLRDTQNTQYGCRHLVTTEGELTVKYKARVEVVAPTFRSLSSLGLTNAASLVYEVTPYSFVVDWLIPIGDYLNSLDAFTGLRVVWVTKTVFYRETTTYTKSFGGTDAAGYKWDSAIAMIKWKKIQCQRTKLATVPPLALPSFKDPVSTGHIANAIALIRQLIRK